MSNNVFDVENGDTLLFELNPEQSPAEISYQIKTISKMFEGQQLKLMFITGECKINLIKSSNLDENWDAELRKDNPALQDAWEQYQIIKNLAKDNNVK